MARKIESPYFRGIGPVCAHFTLETHDAGEYGKLLCVKVALRDCSRDSSGWPARSHDMVRAGAPEWLLSAATSYHDVTEGRGRNKRTYRLFSNIWRARVA